MPQQSKVNNQLVSPFTKEVTQGILHGSAQGMLISLLLNGADKYHTKVILNQIETVNTHKVVNKEISTCIKNEGNKSITITNEVINSTQTTITQKFTNTINSSFRDHPMLGVGYSIRIAVPRQIILLTWLPWGQKNLQDLGLKEQQAKLISSTSTGLINSCLTAKCSVNKTLIHAGITSREIWGNNQEATMKSVVNAARKWGAARDVTYWIIFNEAKGTIYNSMQHIYQKHNTHEHPKTVKDILSASGYFIAGGLAGSLATAFSYPFDVFMKRIIRNPNESQFKTTFQVYQKEGLVNCLKQHTHKLFLKYALPRMFLTSALFNLTLFGVQKLNNKIWNNNDIRYEPIFKKRDVTESEENANRTQIGLAL